MTAATPAAWGRWGADDEAGALNLATPELAIAALGLVRTGTVMSLAQRHGPRHPTAPHRPESARYMMRDAGDYALGARAPGGFRFAEDIVQFGTHNGTHVDALCHAWRGDSLYNGHLASTLRSTTGAQKLGAEKLRPALTRGVLIDLVASNGGTLLPPRTKIDAADLEEATRASGVTPRAGDAVLIRTGWWESASDDDYFDNEPGLSTGGALWLAERDVSLIGADNYGVEVQPAPEGEAFPVHLLLMHERGIPLIENLDLAALAAAGAAEFLFVFAPIPLEGSTGSPLNPLAVL
ncbi:MAG: cyclase family protein [Opitutaceae bacterium]